MEKDKKINIFELVQKNTPYRTPEGYFAQQEQSLKQAVGHQQSVVRPLRRKWWYAAAAGVLLIGGIYGITRWLVHPSVGADLYTSDSAPIYCQTSSASDDWSDFADADIFMDNMNW